MLAAIGSFCLSVCAIPLAWTSWREKTSKGVPTMFLVLWTIGEIALLVEYYQEIPLVVNYLINLVCLAVVWRYKI